MSVGAVHNKLNKSTAAERLNLFKWQPLIFQADQIKKTPFIVYTTVGSNTGIENVKHLCSSKTSHPNWPIFHYLNLSPQSDEPLVM